MKNYETATVTFHLYGLEEVAEMLNDDDYLTMCEGEVTSDELYEVTCLKNETMEEYGDDDISRNIEFAVKVNGDFWDAIILVTYQKKTLNSPAKLHSAKVDDFWMYDPIIQL